MRSPIGTHAGTPGCREVTRGRGLRRFAIAAALVPALAVGACGGSDPADSAAVATGSWTDIVAAAEKEGKVTVYAFTKDEDGTPRVTERTDT